LSLLTDPLKSLRKEKFGSQTGGEGRVGLARGKKTTPGCLTSSYPQGPGETEEGEEKIILREKGDCDRLS